MPGPTVDLAREAIAHDEQSVTADFIAFLKAASAARHPTGAIRRFNQARASGCVEAEFTVVTGLADELKVGLFQQPRSYSAWIRFANATSASDREKDVRGMSIKVRGVRGDNLTPRQRCAGLRAQQPSGDDGAGPARVPRSAARRRSRRLAAGSLLPHAPARRAHRLRVTTAAVQSPRHPVLEHDAVSVRRRPRRQVHRPAGVARTLSPANGDRYLPPRRAALATVDGGRGASTSACSFRRDARTMPIEDASVEWSERDSPYVRVAEVRIPRQSIDVPGRDAGL